MNKKRLNLLLTIVAMAFVLTGCSNSTELISLDTTFKEVMNDGFFAGVITYPLAQAINYLEPKTGIFLAITLVTVAINIVVLAFTFKSSIAMQRMQEIQPELTKIQAKYEGRTDQQSQQRMAMEMQQIYGKYNINPIGTLVTTFIQFPLLIGMYNAVRRSDAVAHAEIFKGTSLHTNLALSPSQALKEKAWVCLIIFVLMVIFQLLSIKVSQWLAEYHGRKEAEAHHKTYQKPQQQNALMTYAMIGMVAFAMFSCPSALSLYYCIYSIINIIKTFVVDKISHKGDNK